MAQDIILYLNWLSALFALIAAFFWHKSSIAKVIYSPQPGGRQIIVQQGAEKWDLIKTLVIQSIWSRRAAIMASLAAICQSVALAIPK